jgi:hypothetical protein
MARWAGPRSRCLGEDMYGLLRPTCALAYYPKRPVVDCQPIGEAFLRNLYTHFIRGKLKEFHLRKIPFKDRFTAERHTVPSI